ncbi:polysaccharide biosynthesis/export family protein [Litorimonas sp. RW-G-Af-16]|uniref:polysaccharide biosynthesis/export family protein n=1 Tax=Litorimonas sp. RW-G-Af-16 TaxID=3241168 RepID=UPI00390C9A22
MLNPRFICHFTAVLLASAAILSLESDAQAQSRYGTNQPVQQHYPQGMVNQHPAYGPQKSAKKYKNVFHRMRGQRHLAYQTPPPPGMFQQWVEYEPQYELVPGDQLDIVVSSAPELSRTLTVGPDGRVVMPMSRPIMAAGRTFMQVQYELMAELSKQLRDPTIAVTPRAYAPEQIYVGGEVGQPGTYTLPGRIGALEGILMAGGMRPTARTRQVAVLRRAPNGGMMMRTVDIRNGLLNIREYNDNLQLRRGDIIYVPQSNIAEIGTFMQNFRNALPVDFNLSYQFGNNGGGTTVISP